MTLTIRRRFYRGGIFIKEMSFSISKMDFIYENSGTCYGCEYQRMWLRLGDKSLEITLSTEATGDMETVSINIGNTEDQRQLGEMLGKVSAKLLSM